MKDTTKLAEYLARSAHCGQKYKGSEIDCIIHIEQIVKTIYEFGNKSWTDDYKGLEAEFWNNIISTAWLYDIPNHTEITLDMIRTIFGDNIGLPVSLCSDGIGHNRSIRKRFWMNYWENIEEKMEKARNTNHSEFEKFAMALDIASIVKMVERYCDIKHAAENNMQLLDMYKGEHNEFVDLVWTENVAEIVGACSDLLGLTYEKPGEKK